MENERNYVQKIALISICLLAMIQMATAFTPPSETVVVPNELNDSLENAQFFDHEMVYTFGSNAEQGLLVPYSPWVRKTVAAPAIALFSSADAANALHFSVETTPRVFWRRAKAEQEGVFVVTLEYDAGTDFSMQAFNSCRVNLCETVAEGNAKTCVFNVTSDFYYFKVENLSGTGQYTLDVDFEEGTANTSAAQTCSPVFIESISPAIDPVLEQGESIDFATTITDYDADPITISWEVDEQPTGETSELFSFDSSKYAVGDHLVTVRASDGVYESTYSWIATVLEPPAPVCEPNTSSICSGNDVYAVDSCGNIGELVQACGSRVCKSGTCVEPPPQPVLTLDQKNNGSVNVGVNAGLGSSGIRQSFVPELSGELSHIRIPLSFYNGSPGNLQLRIESDASGQPSGQLAGSGCATSIPGFSQPAYSAFEWKSFNFTGNCAVHANTKYWITVWADAGVYIIYLTTADNYPRGSIQGYNPAYDILFEEWVYATPEAGPVCTPAARTMCMGNDVYSQDSCGNTETVIEACGNNTCQEGACVAPPASPLAEQNDVSVQTWANGGFGASTKIAQSILPATNARVSAISFPISYLDGSPGSITLRIESDSAGNPSGSLVNTACEASSAAFTSPAYSGYGWSTFTFPSDCILPGQTTSWLVLSSPGSTSASSYVSYLSLANNYANGTAKYYNGNWNQWNANYDLIFRNG